MQVDLIVNGHIIEPVAAARALRSLPRNASFSKFLQRWVEVSWNDYGEEAVPHEILELLPSDILVKLTFSQMERNSGGALGKKLQRHYAALLDISQFSPIAEPIAYRQLFHMLHEHEDEQELKACEVDAGYWSVSTEFYGLRAKWYAMRAE